jgi:hypothetical protein
MIHNARFALALLFVAALTTTAAALPPLPPYVAEHYKAQPEYAKFEEAFSAQKMKCDACHKPGADKKAKGHGLNDFGEAVHKHLKHKDFLAAHKVKADDPAAAAKATQLVADALKAAEAEKNADGKTFGELIKAGQLPGKN